MINGFVFHGRQVVTGTNVEEVDSRKTGRNSRVGGRKRKYRQRYRDSVRKLVFGVNCVIIAVENQDLIHYAMPIRVMDGDALEYSEQLILVQKRHKEQRDLLDEGEFLGGFAKDDKVPGTISLVIYYGKKPWDGAKDLYEILDLSGIPEDLIKLVNHYPIHVLEVHRFKNTEWFQTDLREVFEFIQCADDDEKMEEFVELRKDKLADMSEDACDVIAAVMKMDDISLKDEKYLNKKGGINLCKAMRDWGARLKEEGRQEGRHEAAIALFQYGMSMEDVASVFNLGSDLVKSWYGDWSKTMVTGQSI